MRLTWRATDPESARALVAAHGALDVLVEPTRGREHERLEADGPPGPGVASVLPAVGWASVDAGRLAGAWDVVLEEAGGDDWLGAAAWRVLGRAPATFLVEPSTEGRLAGALARLGEGPVALYLPAPLDFDFAAARATPAGPGALVTPARRFGPFVLLVADAARLPSSS